MRSRKHWQGASLARSSPPLPAGVPARAGVGDRALCVHHRGPDLPVPAARPHAALVRVAFAREDIWQAMRLSLVVASVATLLAILLGTLAAFAMARRPFPGKESITLLFVLPIALPGIITGLALLAGIRAVGLEPGFWTIVAGHATFCLVIVYNNVVARLRRIPPSWSRPRWTSAPMAGRPSVWLLLPQIATALLAGGMLAFALSFDEIIVTLFTAGTSRPCDLVLQRIVPPARAADHQRRGRGRDPGNAFAYPSRVLPHQAG